MKSEKILIIIPARMGSTRLPNKPLADIAGLPMIVHVAKQAQKAQKGDILVATDNKEIARIVENHNFRAFVTQKEHLSGSDRIYEALSAVDKEQNYQHIVNLQGDLPNIDPKALITLMNFLLKTKADIVTLGAYIADETDKNNPNIVKIIASPFNQTHFKALYFTRAKAPYGKGPLYHHIGIYGYKRQALEKFVTLPPSALEQQEKLEQLRALENQLSIEGVFVDQTPISVDTEDDLIQIRNYFKQLS